MDTTQVRTAHADAWEAHGRHRVPYGGGVARMPGIRLMASGIGHPQWNNGDVIDPTVVDVEAVARWYAERGLPWGVRVPAGLPWPHGRHLFGKRLMGLAPARFQPAPAVPGLVLRMAGPSDLEAVLAVDSVAFEESAEAERPWIAPMLTQPGMTVCLAERDGVAVGVGNALRTDGDAGPAVYVAGIGVLPGARGCGVGAAVSSWLVEDALADGAQLAHLHPDTDAAARIYCRLGFVEVDGFDIYVELA